MGNNLLIGNILMFEKGYYSSLEHYYDLIKSTKTKQN